MFKELWKSVNTQIGHWKRAAVPRSPLKTRTKLRPTKKSQLLVLPYIKWVSEKLHRIYRKHNITLCSKPGRTIRQALIAPKDPVDMLDKCGVIYNIDCGSCPDNYIGETVELSMQHLRTLRKFKNSWLAMVDLILGWFVSRFGNHWHLA